MKENKIKWASIVPLVGGMSIGNYMATETKPEFILSYPGFMGNDKHIRNYWPDIPYSLINEDNTDLLEDDIQIEHGCYRCHKENLKAKFDDIDFISAVPPCAGLSMMNSSSKKGSNSARGSDAIQNQWMYKSAEFVLENIKPKVLFGENAPGLYTKTGQGVVENLKEIAKTYGYSFSLYKTNTLYHGIPQRRERTFYFFWQAKNAPILDWYRRDYEPLVEYLKKIPEQASMQDWIVSYNDFESSVYYKFMKHKFGDEWREKTKKSKTLTCFLVDNKLLTEAIEFSENSDNEKVVRYLKHVENKISMKKGWWDGSPHFFYEYINAVIARTIETSIHPTENRGLNVREFAHLMGLPHDFELENVKQYNHLAQNVPTCTARDMTYEIIKFIKGDYQDSGHSFVKQTNSAQRNEIPKVAKKLF